MPFVNGWLDWAKRVDGIPDKVYTQKNSGEKMALHSIVGRETAAQDGIPNRFLSTAKNADGSYTDAAAASCKFIIRESGLLIQMYALDESTWTTGGREANCSSDAVEAEGGGPGEETVKLTPAAADTFIRLYTDIERERQWAPATAKERLWQHKDFAAYYKTAATACASNRYSEAVDRIIAGERYGIPAPTPVDDTLEALVAIMGGRDRILAARKGGMDYLLGYALEQTAQRQMQRDIDGIHNILVALSGALAEYFGKA